MTIKNDTAVYRFLAVYSFLSALIFFAAMYVCSGFKLSAPLDDAFIYFNYAKNTAAGRFMEYVSGQGYSSGATSFLYVMLITPFAFLFKGASIIAITYIIGGVALFTAALYVYRTASFLCGKKIWGLAAAVLLITNGNILWGVFSGMEIGLFMALIASSYYYAAIAKDNAKASVSMALLSIVRPEGFGLVAIFIILRIINKAFNSKEKVLIYFLSLIPGTGYFVMNKIMTGDFMPNTMRAKSNFSLYYYNFPDIFAQGLELFNRFSKEIFNGTNAHYYPQGVFILFMAGVVPFLWGEISSKKTGPYLMGFVWFVFGVMSTVFSSFAVVHNYRYTMPFCVLYTVLAVKGVDVITEMFVGGNEKNRKIFLWSLFFAAVLFNFFTIIANIINFGRDCRDIRSQSISAGLWLKENIREDEIIAINDAGAIAYFSGKRVFDMVGLVTNGQAKKFQNGKAGVFEEIEHIRPKYWLVHVGWFNYEPYTIWKKPRLAEFNIKREPAYYVVGSPEVCVETDFSLFDSGNKMKINHGNWKEIDRLDTCDMRSEIEHEYRIWVKYRSEYPGTILEEDDYRGTAERVLDAGRITSGGMEFTVKNIRPGSDMLIVNRAFDSPSTEVEVFVDNQKPLTWNSPETKGFSEPEILIPGELIKKDTVKIKLIIKSKNRFNSFHFWFLQKEA